MSKVKSALLAVAAVALLSLSACADDTPKPTSPQTLSTDDNNNYIYETEKKLSDGRTVKCLVYNSYQEGGIDCDWASAPKK